MNWAIRTSALAAGTAALIFSQAAYAAPVSSNPAIDPLVSLSLLGSAQSRAAICAGASTAAAGAASFAAQAPAPNCLLPLTGPTPVPQAVPPEPVAPLAPPPPGKDWTTLALIGVGLLAIIVAAVLLLDDDDGEGPLIPISPA